MEETNYSYSNYCNKSFSGVLILLEYFFKSVIFLMLKNGLHSVIDFVTFKIIIDFHHQ